MGETCVSCSESSAAGEGTITSIVRKKEELVSEGGGYGAPICPSS